MAQGWRCTPGKHCARKGTSAMQKEHYPSDIQCWRKSNQKVAIRLYIQCDVKQWLDAQGAALTLDKTPTFRVVKYDKPEPSVTADAAPPSWGEYWPLVKKATRGTREKSIPSGPRTLTRCAVRMRRTRLVEPAPSFQLQHASYRSSRLSSVWKGVKSD